MLGDLAEGEPADENPLAASRARMNEPRRADLAGPAVPSDAAIIGRSVAVPECFAEIFDGHAEGIYRYAARRVGQQAAADVVSEVFLAAFRNRRRYDTGRDDARPLVVRDAPADRTGARRAFRQRPGIGPAGCLGGAVLRTGVWFAHADRGQPRPAKW